MVTAFIAIGLIMCLAVLVVAGAVYALRINQAVVVRRRIEADAQREQAEYQRAIHAIEVARQWDRLTSPKTEPVEPVEVVRPDAITPYYQPVVTGFNPGRSIYR